MYPDYAYDFSGISFSVGASVKLTITATSTTSAVFVIQNLTTGTSVTKTVSSTTKLCEANAEWILEVFPTGTITRVPNFGKLTINNALATLSGGGSEGPSGATKIEEITNLVDVTTTPNSITFTYV